MTRFGLFMFHVCALAWALVATSERALAQCDVDVATSLVFSQGEPTEGYGLALETVAEHTSGDLAGLTTYRLYMQTAHPTDRVMPPWGTTNSPLSLMPETSFYQNPFGNNNRKAFLQHGSAFYPELAYDSWVTIGLDGPSSASAGEEGRDHAFRLRMGKCVWFRPRVCGGERKRSGWTVIPMDRHQHHCRP